MKSNDRFSIVAFTNPGGTEAWRVTGYKPDGVQVRLNFKSYAEALGKKNELEVEALNLPVAARLKHTRLTDAQLTEAEAAFHKLDGKSLLGAVSFYLEHADGELTQVTVAEAHREFLAWNERKNLRKRTKDDYRSRLSRLRPLAHFIQQLLQSPWRPNL